MNRIIKILLLGVGIEYAIIGFLGLSTMMTREIDFRVIVACISFFGGIGLVWVILLTTIPKYFLKLLCEYIGKIVDERIKNNKQEVD